jgi:hypothetical protein
MESKGNEKISGAQTHRQKGNVISLLTKFSEGHTDSKLNS